MSAQLFAFAASVQNEPLFCSTFCHSGPTKKREILHQQKEYFASMASKTAPLTLVQADKFITCMRVFRWAKIGRKSCRMQMIGATFLHICVDVHCCCGMLRNRHNCFEHGTPWFSSLGISDSYGGLCPKLQKVCLLFGEYALRTLRALMHPISNDWKLYSLRTEPRTSNSVWSIRHSLETTVCPLRKNA